MARNAPSVSETTEAETRPAGVDSLSSPVTNWTVALSKGSGSLAGTVSDVRVRVTRLAGGASPRKCIMNVGRIAEDLPADAQHHWPVPFHQGCEGRVRPSVVGAQGLLEESSVREVADHSEFRQDAELTLKVAAQRSGRHTSRLLSEALPHSAARSRADSNFLVIFALEENRIDGIDHFESLPGKGSGIYRQKRFLFDFLQAICRDSS
jgi:hypothetical protein